MLHSSLAALKLGRYMYVSFGEKIHSIMVFDHLWSNLIISKYWHFIFFTYTCIVYLQETVKAVPKNFTSKITLFNRSYKLYTHRYSMISPCYSVHVCTFFKRTLLIRHLYELIVLNSTVKKIMMKLFIQ